jgi:hypothetical protein
MSWSLWILSVWMLGHILIPPVLYYGYGFVMAAQRAGIEQRSLPHVVQLDTALAVPVIVLDGAYNAFWLPAICADPRPWYSFRMVKVWGMSFPFFELVTERFSRYNEDAHEWKYRRKIAGFVADFLDGKDFKGWHIRKQKGENA